MKKLFQAFTLTVLTFIGLSLAPISVGAVDITSPVCTATGNKPVVCKDAAAARTGNPLLGPTGIVTRGVQIFIMIVGVVTLFVMLINAVRMMTSMGNPDSANSARNGIIYAAIGLVIVIGAQSIVTFVLRKL